MLKKIYVLLFSLTVSLTQGQLIQPDSVYTVEEVQIPSSRLNRFATGSKIIEIDSMVLTQHNNRTLAELLANESQVFVKSYGIAGLSSPSFRGTNASQTAILWNGFNISSPMNGMQDLTLLPVGFSNDIKIQYGGSSALWGSGAIGGSIHLINTPEFNKGLSASTSLSIGSFDAHQENIEMGISTKRFISITKFFHHEAKNNFPYTNIAQFGKPEHKMSNAEFNQNGLLQENYVKLTQNQTLSLRFWYQHNHRNIPGSMTVAQSKADQTDEALRSTIEWQRIKDKTSYFMRAAYFDEALDYTDPQINLISTSRSKALITEAEVKYKLTDNQLLNIGINNTYNQATTENYNFSPTQNKTSFFGSYQLKNKKSTFRNTLSARQEFVSNGLRPFTASFGTELWLLKTIRTRGSISKNYRLPTFNDLYWAQGGNPNLLPEDGLSEEIGLAYILYKDKFAIEYELTGINSNVKNWIMWIPNDVGIWSPKNVVEVWSRGIENDLKVSYTLGKIKTNVNVHYQFIKTTNEKIMTNDQSSLHNQLIYTPTEKISSRFGVEFKRFRIGITYNYIGYRYTTSDNSQYLDPYYTLNIDLSKTVVLNHLAIKSYIQLNNITNESYQIIAFYPTPRQNFQIGLVIHFNKPNNQSHEIK